MTRMGRVRRVAAGALSAAAGVLGLTARMAEQGASLLRGASTPQAPEEAMPWDRPRPAPAGATAPEASARDASAPEEAAPQAPRREATAAEPAEPDLDRPWVRSPETHAAALVARPAAEVIAAVDDLSTDELRALYEQESKTKKRKSVLAAIEQALSP